MFQEKKKKHEREKEYLSSLTSLLPFMKSMTGDLLIRDFSLSEERMFNKSSRTEGAFERACICLYLFSSETVLGKVFSSSPDSTSSCGRYKTSLNPNSL